MAGIFSEYISNCIVLVENVWFDSWHFLERRQAIVWSNVASVCFLYTTFIHTFVLNIYTCMIYTEYMWYIAKYISYSMYIHTKTCLHDPFLLRVMKDWVSFIWWLIRLFIHRHTTDMGKFYIIQLIEHRLNHGVYGNRHSPSINHKGF